MLFDWDPIKAAANLEKHGVSFEEVTEIWRDSDLMIVHAKNIGEKRLMAIGASYSTIFSVIHTQRGEAIRIISARRSTQKERQAYERNRNNRR